MKHDGAELRVAADGARVCLAFAGRLDAQGCGKIWREAMRAAGAAGERALVFDVADVVVCDTAGATLLLEAEQAHGEPAGLVGASEPIQTLLARVRQAGGPPARPAVAPARQNVAAAVAKDWLEGVGFIGDFALALRRLYRHRRMLRLAEVLIVADRAGLGALPLVLLLGYLIGLILAFQSAVPMRRFGADIFVANLVALALLRELGPLLAAIVLAGRTGSAYAAELGTMKVNEELDALATMRIDPMTMLVLPRIGAAMLVMPGLAVSLEIAGLAGMTTVMMLFGFPASAIFRQVARVAHPWDLIEGLLKAVCFGAAVAAIGCRCGLATGIGPRAVGLSTTRAVVGGIVASIVLDGLFAVFFYRLGL
jgi:phospholipid/cholesterol/gamma-HCH transport system permease protein